MGVDALRLAGLEAIDVVQQALGLVQVDLDQLVGPIAACLAQLARLHRRPPFLHSAGLR